MLAFSKRVTTGILLTIGTFNADLRAADEKPALPHELGADEAKSFAKSVLAAAKQVQESSILKLNRGELVSWAVRGLYGCHGEEIAPQINQRLERRKGAEEHELLEVLCEARSGLGNHAELAERGDVLIAIQQMVRKFDPSGDFRFDGLSSFRHGSTPVGIGLALTTEETRKFVRVTSLAKDGPACRAGIRSGDRITHVTLFTDAVGDPLDRPEVISTKMMSPPDLGRAA